MVARSAPQITRLSLENFKGFRSAKLRLEALTVLIGANATGKSNILDALHLLKLVATSETPLSVSVNEFIRGGVQGLFRHNTDHLSVEIEMVVDTDVYNYRVELALKSHVLVITRERLATAIETIFDVRHSAGQEDSPPTHSMLYSLHRLQGKARRQTEEVREALDRFRFFQLNPDLARAASDPSVKALDSFGGGLPTVLRNLWTSSRRDAMMSWLDELLPGEIAGLEFQEDQKGRVLLELAEPEGTITAESASDGTIRYLCILAMLFGESPGTLILEEVENGLYPQRQHLVLQLIQQALASHPMSQQVLLTTHSPTLLLGVGEDWQDSVLFVFKTERGSKVRRVADLPRAVELAKTQGLARLHESGWLEDAIFFEDEDEVA